MSKFKIDAIEVATSIHKGDFSKLRGKSFEMCDNTNMRNHYTLSQRVSQLETSTSTIDKRLDRIEESIANLAKQINSRFDIMTNDVNSLKQDVKGINARLDRVENRLDYVVEANNLKDSR